MQMYCLTIRFFKFNERSKVASFWGRFRKDFVPIQSCVWVRLKHGSLRTKEFDVCLLDRALDWHYQTWDSPVLCKVEALAVPIHLAHLRIWKQKNKSKCLQISFLLDSPPETASNILVHQTNVPCSNVLFWPHCIALEFTPLLSQYLIFFTKNLDQTELTCRSLRRGSQRKCELCPACSRW